MHAKVKQALDRSLIKEVSGFARIRLSAICSVCFVLAPHLFCWFNSLYSHDSLMVIQNDWAHQIGIGRFLQEPYVLLRGDVVAPWLIGCIGSAFLVLSILIIVHLRDLKKPASIVLLSGILATNVTITLINATYIDWYDIMMLSLLLSCAAVWVGTKYKYGFLGTALLIATLMGLYQGYFEAAALLVVIASIHALCSGTSARRVFSKWIK